MPLVLNVISLDNVPPHYSLTYTFDRTGGTIGRNPSNTWVLPDEQRHVSGSHAVIEWVNGDYYIVDTSTNGVFIDSGSQPLGRDNRKLLEDGMMLEVGGYKVAVNILSNSQNSQESSDNSSYVKEVDEIQVEHHPVDTGSSVLGMAGEVDIDKLIPDDNADSKISEDYQKNNNPVNQAYIPTRASVQVTSTEITDQSQENKEKPDSEVERLVIPPNWRESEPDPFIDPPLPAVDTPIPTSDREEHIPRETETVTQTIKYDDTARKQHTQPLDNQLNQQTINEKKNTITQPSKSIEQGDRSAMQAFLKGAGLDENTITQEETLLTMEAIGKLFRIAIEGTMEVLASRAKIKNEMIPMVEMTTIQKVQNNPIKLSVNIEEAMQRLLSPQNTFGYMNPEQALHEAYDDIKGHQIAVVAGFQQSLVHVFKRFEPERLIQRLEEDSPISANIPLQREASLWNKFEGLYEAIADEAEDDFNRLFGQEFAKAYDEQMLLLRQQWSNEVEV